MAEVHEEIRNRLARYAELMDTGDFAGLGRLFGDARLCHPDGTVFAQGSAQAEEYWRGLVRLYDGTPRTRHLSGNIIIETSERGRRATARPSIDVFQAVHACHCSRSSPVPTSTSSPTATTGGCAGKSGGYRSDLVGHLSRHLIRG
jgi:hypothetical protein